MLSSAEIFKNMKLDFKHLSNSANQKVSIKRILRLILLNLFLFVINFTMFAQDKMQANKSVNSKPAVAIANYGKNPKLELTEAIEKSKKVRMVRISLKDSSNENYRGVFEYVSPSSFYRFEEEKGRLKKETIEIARQRYESQNGQWVKIKNDIYPLREQDNFFLPMFKRGKDDLLKVKKVDVKYLGIEDIGEKKNHIYGYQIIYDFVEASENGKAWISESSGVVIRLETDAMKGTRNFDYETELNIRPPQNFVEKNSIN